MKKMIAWILCLCFVLGGCAQGGTAPRSEEGGVAPKPTPAPAAGFEQLALGLAKLPELPAQPDENALWEQMEGKSGEEQNKLWDEFNAQQSAYYDALLALRGDGVDAALTDTFTDYTLCTARRLFADSNGKNVVYSPANLYLALCMLAETADGESRAQLLDLLGLSSVEQARSAANALWRNLYLNGETGKTLLANSIWMNERFGFHEDVIGTLSGDYFASTFRAPMGDAATDEAIREWINENTNHLLEDAANGIETDPNTLMMLISTLYFKGTWADQFSQTLTSEDTFTAADGTEQRIDFMHTVKNGNYCRGENFTVASLPFCDGATMWFLLPDEGVPIESLLSGELPDLESLLAEPRYGEIRWSVPKFDVDSDLDLIPALASLGVTDIFNDAADFSPLTDESAVISAIEHAARVKVDEEGCEAAAFTAINMEATAAMPEQLEIVEMNLDRPFGFLITGVDGLPLFVSVVSTVG